MHWWCVRYIARPYSSYEAVKAIEDENGKVILSEPVKIPKWFYEFAQLDTGGVTKACDEYIDLTGKRKLRETMEQELNEHKWRGRHEQNDND